MEKLNQTVEILSVRLAELIRLSSIENPSSMDDDDDNIDIQDSNLAIATSSTMMVNSHTMQLIRGVQDLLALTRNMREKWLLNQIPEQNQRQEDTNSKVDHEELATILEKTMQEIVNEHTPSQ